MTCEEFKQYKGSDAMMMNKTLFIACLRHMVGCIKCTEMCRRAFDISDESRQKSILESIKGLVPLIKEEIQNDPEM